MAIKKVRMRPETVGGYDTILHPETSADMVLMGDGSNAKDKINELINIHEVEVIKIPYAANAQSILDSIVDEGLYLIDWEINNNNPPYRYGFYVRVTEYIVDFPPTGDVKKRSVQEMFNNYGNYTIRNYNHSTGVWSGITGLSYPDIASGVMVTGSTTVEANITKSIYLGFRPRYIQLIVYKDSNNAIDGTLIPASSGKGHMLEKTNGTIVSSFLANSSSVFMATDSGFDIKTALTGVINYMAIR